LKQKFDRSHTLLTRKIIAKPKPGEGNKIPRQQRDLDQQLAYQVRMLDAINRRMKLMPSDLRDYLKKEIAESLSHQLEAREWYESNPTSANGISHATR
jgi:hypothetical protein